MEIGEGNGKIYIGIPRERFYYPEFVDNRDKILRSLHEAGLSCGYYQASGHRVDRNRDRIVKIFLEHQQEPEWLLFLDSDMEHIEDIGQRLVRWQKPIVGGLYFNRNEWHDPFAFIVSEPDKDEYGRIQRMWKPLRDEAYDFILTSGIPKRDRACAINADNGLVECDAVATGAMLIHRSVLEAMKPGPWFEYVDGGMSEDLMFCAHAKENYGFSVYCDFSTISGHFTLVPMGYAEFMNVYEGRGVEHTAYSKSMAVDMLAEFYEQPRDSMQRWFEFGEQSAFVDYWRGLGEDFIKSVPEHDIYTNPDAGHAYVKELLYWNATPEFNSLRRLYIPMRNKTILEIGAGIGTLALQLTVQRNDVVAVEINPILREFISFREKKVREKLVTRIGTLRLLGDDWREPSISHARYDNVFAIDTFEHMPLEELTQTIYFISYIMKPGARLCYHANWKQQDAFPMHHDHSEAWKKLLPDAGFYPLSPIEAVRM